MPSGGTGAFVLRVSSSAGLLVTKETQVLRLARKHGCSTAAANTFDIERLRAHTEREVDEPENHREG